MLWHVQRLMSRLSLRKTERTDTVWIHWQVCPLACTDTLEHALTLLSLDRGLADVLQDLNNRELREVLNMYSISYRKSLTRNRSMRKRIKIWLQLFQQRKEQAQREKAEKEKEQQEEAEEAEQGMEDEDEDGNEPAAKRIKVEDEEDLSLRLSRHDDYPFGLTSRELRRELRKRYALISFRLRTVCVR